MDLSFIKARRILFAALRIEGDVAGEWRKRNGPSHLQGAATLDRNSWNAGPPPALGLRRLSIVALGFPCLRHHEPQDVIIYVVAPSLPPRIFPFVIVRIRIPLAVDRNSLSLPVIPNCPADGFG